MLGFWLLIVFCVCLLFLIIRIQRPKNFPPGPRPVPLLGNLFNFTLKNPLKDFEKLAEQYGNVYSLYVGTKPIVVLHGLKVIREALVNKAADFSGRPHNLIKDVTQGKGIIVADYGVQWKEHRRFALMTLRNFGLGKQSMENRILGELQHLVAKLDKHAGSSMYPQTLFHDAASNIIYLVLFGTRFDYGDEILKVYVRLYSENTKLASGTWAMIYDALPMLRYLPLPYKKIFDNYSTIKSLTINMINKHKTTRVAGKPRDLVDCYLDELDKRSSESTFSIEQLVVFVMNLHIAGTDTTSNTLLTAILYLMIHPDIQKRCQKEIDEVIGTQTPPSFEDRHNMPYTQAMIHEIQRLANTVPLSVFHCTTRDTELMGFTIPKGTTIIPNLSSVLSEEGQWKFSHDFNPSNFLNKQGHFEKPEAFLPFSTGPRMCLGEGLARMELFLFLIEDGISDCSEDEPLNKFLLWCDEVNLLLSDKVYLSKEGTAADYGMLAKEDIEEGHVLFSIPRCALLHPGTSKTKDVLEEGRICLESPSGWVPLLLALMYEYTSAQSCWKPYLNLWPDFKKLDHPMFWSAEERDKLLKGTGIPEAVNTDLSNIQKEYNNTVLPFIRSHPALWDPDRHTLELYQSLVAFVMAYSFQEPVEDEDEDEERDSNPPMMVPMADMLNHVSNHNANLEYTPECLKMVAVRPITKGEEIFNTYGQMANWQLLHMYGFSEPFPTNANDTADVHMSALYEAAAQAAQNEAEQRLLVDKWKMLRATDVVEEKGAFVFGKNGSLTDTELYVTLKVLCMSKEEFREFQENEGWEEDEGDEDDSRAAQALSFGGISAGNPQWKQLLHTAAGFTLNQYAEDVESDLRTAEEPKALEKLGHRERTALQVRLGQKSIVQKLLELTRTPTAFNQQQ